MTPHEWCRAYIIDRCIERSAPQRPIVGVNGKANSWQLFIRRALYDAEFSSKAAVLVLDQILSRLGRAEWQLAGMESGAVPLLVAIGYEAMRRRLPLNVFSVRKQPKPYGIFNRFEGAPRQSLVTVLVDDVVHSGRSIGLCRTILEDAGIMVLEDVYCIVGPGANVHSLCTLDDLGLKG